MDYDFYDKLGIIISVLKGNQAISKSGVESDIIYRLTKDHTSISKIHFDFLIKRGYIKEVTMHFNHTYWVWDEEGYNSFHGESRHDKRFKRQ